MLKRILYNFLIEKLATIITYFMGNFIILIYIHIYSGAKGFAYPIVLSIIIFIIYLVIEWTKYYKFNLDLYNYNEDEYLELRYLTNSQKAVAETIYKMHESYAERISRILQKNVENKYFISQWIHNMKTPVSVIKLILQNARDADNIEQGILQDIEEENVKLQNGLEQVLNILRLEDFSRDYEPEAVELIKSLKAVINNKRSQFIYNKVFPKIEYTGEEITVLTDRKWNEFMLEQLISNAIKYSTGRKEKYIYFNIKQNKTRTLLQIRDEGIGIPAADLRRVYEPFFTGENGRKHKDSTGVGLYICKNIAQNLGHEITIESKENEGTLVTIEYITKV